MEHRQFISWDRIESRNGITCRSDESGGILCGCLRSPLVMTSGEYRLLVESKTGAVSGGLGERGHRET